MRKSLAAFCLETGLVELLRQWEQQQNAPLTPETISYGSKRKVLVALQQGAQLAGTTLCTNRQRDRLPILCREAASPR